MISVMQDSFAPNDFGNCTEACVASIIERPLHLIPQFLATHVPQQELVTEFLKSIGWDSIYIQFDEHQPGDERVAIEQMFVWPSTSCLAIVSGHSPRAVVGTKTDGLKHAVVAKPSGYNINYIHDPHPDETFLVGRPTAIRWVFPQPKEVKN